MKSTTSTGNTVTTKTSSGTPEGGNIIPGDLRDPVGPLKAVPVPKPANVKPLKTGPQPKRAPAQSKDNDDGRDE